MSATGGETGESIGFVIPEGYTRGADLALAGVRPGDGFQTRGSKRWPYPIQGRIHKVNRKTFGWEDGSETGRPGERRLWVRKDELQMLQAAAIIRGKVVHILVDPSLAPFEPPYVPTKEERRWCL